MIIPGYSAEYVSILINRGIALWAVLKSPNTSSVPATAEVQGPPNTSIALCAIQNSKRWL